MSNPTGQTIINNALTTLGVLEQGGTPSVSDSNDGLTELNALWDAWGIDEGLIYALVSERFPLVASIAQYTIGPGGQFNVEAPGRIYKARVSTASGGAISGSSLGSGGQDYEVNDTGVVLGASGSLATYTVTGVSGGAVTTYTLSGAGTGYVPGYGYQTQTAGGQPGTGTGFTINIASVTFAGETRVELEIVDAVKYYSHRDLSASALTPDEMYPDYNPDADGLERLYLWPIPNVAAPMMLQLDMGVPFVTWTLAGEYNLPPGALDAIDYALAFRLIPRYGAIVDPKVVEVVTAMAEKSEARFRDAVAKNRQIPAPAVAPSVVQPQPAGGA